MSRWQTLSTSAIDEPDRVDRNGNKQAPSFFITTNHLCDAHICKYSREDCFWIKNACKNRTARRRTWRVFIWLAIVHRSTYFQATERCVVQLKRSSIKNANRKKKMPKINKNKIDRQEARTRQFWLGHSGMSFENDKIYFFFCSIYCSDSFPSQNEGFDFLG